MYVSRYAEKKILKFNKQFKITLLLGARQVGKTTLLKHTHPSSRYFVFDPSQDLYNARKNPDLFLETFAPPLILDEIQHTPELLSSIKRFADQTEEKGLYTLTGSQNFNALKTVYESMAGRVGILELSPLTPFEKQNIAIEQTWLHHYLQNPEHFHKEKPYLLESTLLEHMWRGGFPGTLSFELDDFRDFYHSYLQTYTERDIRTLSNISNLHTFSAFLKVQAALTAQETNHSQLSNAIGITLKTVKEWADLQSYAYQTFTIPPYSGNILKRVSKSPKSYIRDSGFACYLMNIPSIESLIGHPSFGALFETFCVNFIRTHLAFEPASLFHWRSHGGTEVDLIIEYNNQFYPIEFKTSTAPCIQDARGILQFMKSYPHLHINKGIVVHGGRDITPLTDYALGIPWNLYFQT